MDKKSNCAEHLVENKDGQRYYEGKRLLPSEMLWMCTTESCSTPPKIRRRGQYESKLHCNACANRIKGKDPEILKRRGQAIAKAINSLGDKWSKVAKKNMSSPDTRDKISKSLSKTLKDSPELKEISRKTAIGNNKKSGFGTSSFGKKKWQEMDPETKRERVNRATSAMTETERKKHVCLMRERWPGFEVVEFSNNSIYTYRCPEGHEFKMLSGNFLKRGSCPECSCKSTPEIDTLAWIRDFLPKVEHNKRVLYLDDTLSGNRALEIDIYEPNKKIGVELHGMYYHGFNRDLKDAGVPRNYHKLKADLADKHGIFLLQFFEDEVVHKNEIVKSIILSKIGKADKIFARNCEIKAIESYVDSNSFLEENHLQGGCRSFLRMGLYSQGELVSVLTIRKFRSKNENEAEIARFCHKKGLTVIGGFSKLINGAEKILKEMGIDTVYTYADRRYSDGNVYLSNGFSFVKNTEPDMFWVKNGIKYPRQISWGKSNEEMREGRYYRIFGAGHKLFKKQI